MGRRDAGLDRPIRRGAADRHEHRPSSRLAFAGRTDEVARAGVPRRAGGWLLLHGWLVDDDLRGRVSVILQPTATPEIAALIAEAHGLSGREREVTRLVLHGLSTREIAGGLGISPCTVQDHLKAIFEKVGVRSRRELVAQLFLRHYAPRLEGRPPSVRAAGSPRRDAENAAPPPVHGAPALPFARRMPPTASPT